MVWTAYHQDRREGGRTAASLLGCCSFPGPRFLWAGFGGFSGGLQAGASPASGNWRAVLPGGLFSLVAPVWFSWGFTWQPFRAHSMEEAIELREAVVSAVCAKEVMALTW